MSMSKRLSHLAMAEGSLWRMSEPSYGAAKDYSWSKSYHLIPGMAGFAHCLLNNNLDNSAPYNDEVDIFNEFGTITYAPGKVGSGAAVFTGGAYAITGSAYYEFYGGRPWSVSLWLKPSANNPVTSGFGPLAFSMGWAASEVGVGYDSDNQQFEFKFGAGSYHSGAGSYADSAWHHIVMTYDADIRIYIDNVLIHQEAASLDMQASYIRLATGYDKAVYYDGMIDDFRLFAHGALTTAQIDQIWNSGSGTEGDLADTQGPTSIAVANMPFAFARKFDKTNNQYLETWQPVANVGRVAAYVMLNSLPSAGERYHICSRYASGGYGFDVEIYEDSGVVYFRAGSGGADNGAVAWSTVQGSISGIINTSEWFYFSAYFTPTDRALYLNETLIARDETPAGIGFKGGGTYDDSEFTVGNLFVPGTGREGHYFDGIIADLVVSDLTMVGPPSILRSVSPIIDGLKPDIQTIACYNFDGATGLEDDTGNHDFSVIDNIHRGYGTISEDFIWDHGTIPHHADFGDGSRAFTIEMFATINVVNGSESWTILQKDDGVSATYVLYRDAAYLYAKVRDSSGNTVVTKSSFDLTSETDKLSFIAIVWEPGRRTLRLHVNGVNDENSNSDIDPTGLGNTADIEVAHGAVNHPYFQINSLRFSWGTRTAAQMQDALTGMRIMPTLGVL